MSSSTAEKPSVPRPFPAIASILLALAALRIAAAFFRGDAGAIDVAFATLVALLALQVLWSHYRRS